MPTDFRNITKYCLNCGKQLTLNNTRDIQRKKYCSRRCLALYNKDIWQFQRLGLKITKETRKKMIDSKKKLISQGWCPVGWKAYNSQPRLSGRGYIFKGNKRLHTLIAEQYLGRKIAKEEVVHHIDENKLNNDPNNLFVMLRKDHMTLHAMLRRANCRKHLLTA